MDHEKITRTQMIPAASLPAKNKTRNMGTVDAIRVFLVSIIFVTSVMATEQPLGAVEQLRWVETANAVADADESAKSDNYQLLAIAGYTWSLPGIDDEKKWAYRDRYGIKLLEGTSDVIQGSEHARLIKLATEYARQYNLRILKHLLLDKNRESSP